MLRQSSASLVLFICAAKIVYNTTTYVFYLFICSFIDNRLQLAKTVCYRLTEDQDLVLRVVEKGHNALISGQAGTGKSYLVKEICLRLKEQGKHVAVVCYSGLAGTVYKDCMKSVPTVHSYYGLGTADIP